MSRERIRDLVIKVLGHYQEISGRPKTAIVSQTCPLTDLPEFDSLNGMEVTVEIETELGVEIPEDDVCLDAEGRPIRVEQVVERISQLMNVR